MGYKKVKKKDPSGRLTDKDPSGRLTDKDYRRTAKGTKGKKKGK